MFAKKKKGGTSKKKRREKESAPLPPPPFPKTHTRTTPASQNFRPKSFSKLSAPESLLFFWGGGRKSRYSSQGYGDRIPFPYPL